MLEYSVNYLDYYHEYSYQFLNYFPRFRNYNHTEDLAFITIDNTKNDEKNVDQSAYLINGVRKEVFKPNSWVENGWRGQIILPSLRLEVALVDNDGKSLQKEIVEPGNHSAGKILVYSDDTRLGGFPSPWAFLGHKSNFQPTSGVLLAVNNRTFIVYMSVDADALKSAKKITVKLID